MKKDIVATIQDPNHIELFAIRSNKKVTGFELKKLIYFNRNFK